MFIDFQVQAGISPQNNKCFLNYSTWLVISSQPIAIAIVCHDVDKDKQLLSI